MVSFFMCSVGVSIAHFSLLQCIMGLPSRRIYAEFSSSLLSSLLFSVMHAHLTHLDFAFLLSLPTFRLRRTERGAERETPKKIEDFCLRSNMSADWQLALDCLIWPENS